MFHRWAPGISSCVRCLSISEASLSGSGCPPPIRHASPSVLPDLNTLPVRQYVDVIDRKNSRRPKFRKEMHWTLRMMYTNKVDAVEVLSGVFNDNVPFLRLIKGKTHAKAPMIPKLLSPHQQRMRIAQWILGNIRMLKETNKIDRKVLRKEEMKHVPHAWSKYMYQTLLDFKQTDALDKLVKKQHQSVYEYRKALERPTKVQRRQLILANLQSNPSPRRDPVRQR
eukprot:NODE_4675_length_755_cov_29.898089_g4515_i0.p1 GENE.NODE_4675_length_755_cov_29.898089_g4515_i0~~NODE_4675_length_755_cov_29.898089_g4515_i0.p1  ORF type:complete len:241 (-),score=76.98 NODE_4675_length_755_cov_29.898089_g4515_i0:31-705(-)